jgi:hypothetical protein
MKVLIHAPPARAGGGQTIHLNERISRWMWDHNVEHWTSYREDYEYWAVDFIGLNGEEDATAFKLTFGI